MTTANDRPPAAIPEFVDDLAINLKLSEDLLTVLIEESAALRTMDTQSLLRLSRQKDTLLTKILYLDEALRKAVEGQKQGGRSSLTPEGSRLVGQYRSRINSMRQEIRDKNLINKRFAEDTLGYLRDAISLFTRPGREENTYRLPNRSPGRNTDLPSFISCKA